MKDTTMKKAVYTKPLRSKKHKKIKPIDPFFTNRGRPTTSDNLHIKRLVHEEPPKNPEQQEIPKSFISLQLASCKDRDVNKRKRKPKRSGAMKGWSFNDKSEASQKGMTRPLKPVPEFTRMKNESKHNFLKRIHRETKKVLQRSKFEEEYNVTVTKGEDGETVVKPAADIDLIGVMDTNDGDCDTGVTHDKVRNTKGPAKSATKKIAGDKKPDGKLELSSRQRHNKKISERKKMKKLAKMEKGRDEFGHLKDNVEFGEVAMEPPAIKFKPRATGDGSSRPGAKKNLLLSSLMSGATAAEKMQRGVGKTIKSKHLPPGERHQLEVERNIVVERYRQMKQAKYKFPSN